MSRRRLLLLFAVPGLCILGSLLFRHRPPVHQGRTITQWFEEPDVRSQGAGPGSKGLEAFLELRGRAVPFLVRTACKGPNWGSSRYAIFHSGAPPGLQQLFPPARSDSEYRDRQARALWVLGSLVHWERNPSRKWGLTNPPVSIPKVRACVSDCLADPSWMVRIQAASVAGGLGAEGAALVPQLTAMLKNSNESAKAAAIRALSDIGRASAPATEQLSEVPVKGMDHEARPTLQALSDTVRREPWAGLASLYAALLNPGATNLVPLARSLAHHPDARVAHSARLWLEMASTNSGNPAETRGTKEPRQR